MHTLKYRAYIKPLKRYAEKYETILYHHQCNMEPSWTVNISPEEYYGDEELVIEQFTGLLDRNGKEIYEGDIVKITRELTKTRSAIYIYQIRYDSSRAAFTCWRNNHFACMLFAPCEEVEYEVTGNIHENPELLGGEE